MNDRELLEMAAKAIGIKILSWGGPDYYSDRSGLVAYTDKFQEWNPLTDDGDALRLAVRLQIDLDFGLDSVRISEQHLVLVDYVDFGPTDSMTIVRRAIVRAAAEIGKAMQ